MINSRTTLKAIQAMAQRDFGIKISKAQAKEIKCSCQHGQAVWTGELYVSTTNSDDIRYMSRRGVKYGGYQSWYTRQE